MAASVARVLSQVQHWTSARPEDLSDAVLLERFTRQHDETAFAALVARHGAMVLHSCRRILGNVPEAEDTFQATFLILARRASSLKQPDALPGFLHGVARRVALKARKKTAVRPHETPLPDVLPDERPDPLAQLTARELLTVLDEEAARLPAAQRSAVVLCCLEGHAQEEAARILGWTAGSLKGHLERGRRRLRQRLASRGIALSAALAVVAVSHGEAASVLLQQSAVRVALGGAMGGPAAALADGVLCTMCLSKIAGLSALVMTAALAVSAGVVLTYRGPAEPPANQTPAAPKEADAGKPRPRVDALGEPLPAGAIARLGTVRFRHGGRIDFVAFTPDGKRLVSQGADGVRVWDTATGKELRHLAGTPGHEWGSTDLSADGKILAFAEYGLVNAIRLWDIDRGRITGTLGRESYYTIRLSPDGKLLAASRSNSSFRHVELWDVARQTMLRSWEADLPMISVLAFSADSRRLLTHGGMRKYRLWDVATGRRLQEFTPLDWKDGRSNAPWGAAALSPDGNLIALIEVSEKHTPQPGATEWKARISVRDVTTGKQVRQLTCPSREVFPGQTPPSFSALAFTADGKKLLTGGPDRFLRVWDSATGEELHRWPLDHDRPSALALSRDGKTLAVVTRNGGAIQLLDMSNGKARPSPDGHLGQVYLSALTPDGRSAITLGGDGAFLLWDVAGSRIRRRFKGHHDSIFAIHPARDGRTLFTGAWDKTVRVWDLASGEEKRRLQLGRDFVPAPFGAVKVSPDGKTLVLLSSAQTIHVLDAESGRELRRFKGPEWIEGSALTPDGRSLVVWSGDLKVRVWDLANGRLTHEYALPQELRIGQPVAVSGPSPTSYKAALSPDGRLLAVANRVHYRPTEKYFLVLKDMATGRDIRPPDKLPSDVHVLAFSPDGRMLAWSGYKDLAIYLMEVASGRERRRLAGHRGWVLSLAFAPDGERLISSGMDSTALVWNIGSRFDPRKPSRALSAAELEALWGALAGEDAAPAYQAIRQFAVAPEAAVPFLRKRLRPVPLVEEKQLARWIADLDSEDFPIRRKAAAELEKLGELALPAYHQALAGKPSIETRRRLEELREKAVSAWWSISPERLRCLRAVEALELAGTKEARDVLAILAKGAPGTRLTEEAKAALARQ